MGSDIKKVGKTIGKAFSDIVGEAKRLEETVLGDVGREAKRVERRIGQTGRRTGRLFVPSAPKIDQTALSPSANTVLAAERTERDRGGRTRQSGIRRRRRTALSSGDTLKLSSTGLLGVS